MALYSYLVFFVIFHLLLLSFAKEERKFNSKCPFFPCGKLGKIGYPFSNMTHPECGLMIVDNCNETVQKIQLGKEGPWYNITNIGQDISITVEDQVFQNHLNNKSCESLKNLTLPSTPILSFQITSYLNLFRCSYKLDSNLTSLPCKGSFIYYNHTDGYLPSILPPNCSLIQLPVDKSRHSHGLFNMLTSVFSLQVIVPLECFECNWRGGHCQSESNGKFHCNETRECYVCRTKGGHCGIDQIKGFQCTTGTANLRSKLGLGIGISAAAGFCILIIIGIYFRKKISSDDSVIFWKKKTENYRNVEAFLRNYGSLAPKRYSYSDIKKMTYSFKQKLGQGGYGGVYKGKLLDDRIVAVKVLNETKGNGEGFINEVASISRTSHVNIVTLLGFCFEGHRRALIYEFVSNGSLDKFIYGNSSLLENHKLNWETLYQIALGIARGLEYLHRGCGTRILHLDIKPHNILLDEDFCPKISDFGLAKISHRKESIVSMSGARGTLGYIAPEVFCRNIGEVSYKSDVYSYGMMVFEMTGGRKISDVGDNHSSDVYFPHWIYKRLETDEELGIQGIENEDDNEYARKMIIVSLWCIQTNPSNRPTMSRVVEMLEGSLDSLQIPPKPFFSSPGSPSPADSSTTHSILTL